MARARHIYIGSVAVNNKDNQEAAVNWEEEKRLKFLVITELAAKKYN